MRTSAGRTALCALLAALAVALLYLSCLLPSGRWAAIAAAGLTTAAATVSAGLPAGGMTWFTAGVLGILVAPDKGNAVLFLLFFGSYPVVKGLIERLRSLPLELPLKLLFFNGALTLVLFVMAGFLPPIATQYGLWAAYLGGNLLFAIYDFGLSKLIALYAQRIGGQRN